MAVNGQDVSNIVDFVRSLQGIDIGQTVNLTIRRNDRLFQVDVKIMDIS